MITQDRLYFFTSSYPYSGRDRAFVEPQLKYLAQYFEGIILVPYYTEGNPYPLPGAVTCDTTLSSIRERRYLNLATWLDLLRDTLFWSEIRHHPHSVIRTIKQGLVMAATAQWAEKIPATSFCYTLSLDAVTLGLTRVDRGIGSRIVVSRCIGGDVNEEVHSHGFIPFKDAAIQAVDMVFPCSQKMTDCLVSQYSDLSHKIETARMGVSDPGFVSNISMDGTKRIISCGSLNPNKRYDLLAEGMVHLAGLYPSLRFEWRHIPWGAADGFMSNPIFHSPPENLKVYLEDESVSPMEIYQTTPVDLFAHVSASEGLPFVIMEALSCGIPVLATDVGGISEVVDSSTGRLIPSAIDAGELADHLWAALNNPSLQSEQKREARSKWMQVVNTAINYTEFAKRLANINTSREQV